MPRFRVSPYSYVYKAYRIPRWKRRILLELESDEFVDIYLMNEDEFAEIDVDPDPDYSVGLRHRKRVMLDVNLPRGGLWFLVIVCSEDEPAEGVYHLRVGSSVGWPFPRRV